ncbi:MAG: hypothetical protein DMG71_18260, partial [Acidobacteria bacterium]
MESAAANQNPRPTASSAGQRTQSRVVPKKSKRLNHENRILLLALGAGAAGLVVSIVLLWLSDYSDSTRWTITGLITVLWLGFAFSVRSAVAHPLQTLSNMQSALREGDFSFRVRGAGSGDSLGELMLEVNALSDMLREQRL